MLFLHSLQTPLELMLVSHEIAVKGRIVSGEYMV